MPLGYLRVGTTYGLHVYACGEDLQKRDTDQAVAMFRDPEDAPAVVAAWNAHLDDQRAAPPRAWTERELAMLRTFNELDQVLGKALGFPPYPREMFPPGVEPDGSVCTGEHVPETLAAAAAQRLDALADMLGEIQLYVSWRHVTRQLTTDQKELWAAAVERWSTKLNEGTDEAPARADRWWLCPTCGINNRADPASGPHIPACMWGRDASSSPGE